MTGPFLAFLMAAGAGASSAARLRFVVVAGVVDGSLVAAVAGAVLPEAVFLMAAGFVVVAFLEAVVVVLAFFEAATAAAGASSSSRLRLLALGAGLEASTGALMGLVAFLEAVVRVVVFAGAAGAGAVLEAARVAALRGAILSGSCFKCDGTDVQWAT